MKNRTTLLIFASLIMGFAALSQNSQLQQGQLKIQEEIKAESLLDKTRNVNYSPNHISTFGVAEDFGDAPELDWSRKIDGSGEDVARKVVRDDAGNMYVIGDFSGHMTFAGSTLESVGKRDVFVAKLDASANLLWIRHGNCGEFNSTILYDLLLTQDELLITGYFDGDVFTMHGSYLNLLGISDVILLSFSLEGEINLVQNFGNITWFNRGLAIAQDDAGFIYITGTTSGSTNYYHPSFLVKFTPEGNSLWWQEHDISFNDLAVSGDQLYVAGTAFQESWLDDILLNPFGYNDAFVAQANLDGEYNWAVMGNHDASTYGDSRQPQIEVGSSGDIFMAGDYRTSVMFGDFVLNGDFMDAFIVRMNALGEVVWASSTFGTNKELTGFGLLENDYACISGGMSSIASFDDITLSGNSGYYTAIYDDQGNAQHAFSVDYQVSGIESAGENAVIQCGTNTLNARLIQSDYSGVFALSLVSSGNSGNAEVTGMELDDAGVVYSVSNVFGHVNYFDVNVDLAKSGMLLSGQMPNGDVLWLAEIEGGESWWSFTESALNLDQAHNRLYVHGSYTDTLRLGGLEFQSEIRASFMACYSSSGEFYWVKEIPYELNIQSVDTDVFGNVYFVLTFGGTIQIDGQTFTAYSSGDALLLKYNLDGNLVSTKQIQTDVYFFQLGIATINSGGFFITLEPAADTVFFNEGNDPLFLTPNDGRTVVAKYDDQGNYLWAKSFGHSPINYGGYYCWPTASVTDAEGNLYLTGSHADSAMFDDIMIRTPYNRFSPYVAKIGNDGTALWANSIQSHQWGRNYCEADIDSQGNFYCMGEITDTIHFGNWQYIPSGPRDLYLAKYDNDGEINWVKIIETTTSNNHVYGMAVYETDNLFYGGSFTHMIQTDDLDLFTTAGNAGFSIHVGEEIPYTSISDLNDAKFDVDVFPNPAHESISVNFKDLYQNVSIDILDVNGRSVKSLMMKSVSGMQSFDLNGMQSGTYVLKVSADGETFVRKIIMQ